MQLEQLQYPNDNVKNWLVSELAKSGPWTIKVTVKEQINSLLNNRLSGLGSEAIEVRGYLCNKDPDDVWLNSMTQIVLPFIDTKLSELTHG